MLSKGYSEGCNGVGSIALLLHIFADSFPMLMATDKTSLDIALDFMYEIGYIPTKQSCKCLLISQL